MCTRYIAPEVGDIERQWQIGARNPAPWVRDLFPRYAGPFIRAVGHGTATATATATGHATGAERELVVGQWSLVPWFAKTAKLSYPTANARSEELSAKASYKLPWARGQRCIIPALAFYEPNWETGKHVPWRFRRSDGQAWGLAGLWNTWVNPETGEVVESYTMLTLNADVHPLMNRMHKPDPKRPPALQDKRSVVPIEAADVDAWLHAPLEQAALLVRLAPVDRFVAEPEGPTVKQPAPPADSAADPAAEARTDGLFGADPD